MVFSATFNNISFISYTDYKKSLKIPKGNQKPQIEEG